MNHMNGKEIIGAGIDCFYYYVIAMIKVKKQSHAVTSLRAKRSNLRTLFRVIASEAWQSRTNKI